MRLFVAVSFDKAVQKELQTLQDRLRRQGRGSFTRPENWHLTLAFLGEVPEERLEAVCRAMDSVAVPPLRLRFARVGRFRRDEGDVVWVAPEENRALITLWQELSAALEKEGFRLEKRSFVPHVTLCRRFRAGGSYDAAAALSRPFTACADHISLMLSELRDGRRQYREMHRR